MRNQIFHLKLQDRQKKVYTIRYLKLCTIRHIISRIVRYLITRTVRYPISRTIGYFISGTIRYQILQVSNTIYPKFSTIKEIKLFICGIRCFISSTEIVRNEVCTIRYLKSCTVRCLISCNIRYRKCALSDIPSSVQSNIASHLYVKSDITSQAPRSSEMKFVSSVISNMYHQISQAAKSDNISHNSYRQISHILYHGIFHIW